MILWLYYCFNNSYEEMWEVEKRKYGH